MPHRRGTIIVPVKQTAIAKSRLGELGDRVRRRLALAFACDAVAAALECPAIEKVVVVTNDAIARSQLASLGAVVVPDSPDAGLNAALEWAASGVRRLDPEADLAVMSADLPAVRAADIATAFGIAPAPRWFVADHDGKGTTMLAAAAANALNPAFGPDSAAAHRRSGAVQLQDPSLQRLRLDVDTVADLRRAAGLGVGLATTAVLADLGWAESPRTAGQPLS